MPVQQIDMFEYLEQPEADIVACAASCVPAPRMDHVAKIRRDFVPSWFLRGVKWFLRNLPLLFLFQWVNVYSITRGFGGRENGGWYYRRFTCEESRLVYRWEAKSVKMALERQYAALRWGQISAETQGQDVVVCVEDRKNPLQTRSKPDYTPERIHNRFILEG